MYTCNTTVHVAAMYVQYVHAGAHKEKEHLTPYSYSEELLLSGVVMWYKLTNPQETNIALNIIISTGNDIQILDYFGSKLKSVGYIISLRYFLEFSAVLV